MPLWLGRLACAQPLTVRGSIKDFSIDDELASMENGAA